MRPYAFVTTTSSVSEAEPEQRCRVPGELLRVRCRPLRDEPVAREPPGRERDQAEDREGEHRPRSPGLDVGRERSAGAVGPGTDQVEEDEDRADRQPEQEPAAERAEGRRERNPAAARAGEEVDRRGQERQRHRREDELDRPAAEDPVTEVEVAGRRRPGLDALVEREQELLRGAAQLSEPLGVQRPARVERRVAAPLGGRRQRHGGDATRDERRLLGERVREARASGAA